MLRKLRTRAGETKMLTGWLRPFGSRRGQSLVEFTIMLPILLIMLSGLVEFGFLLNHYLDVIDSARETARFGSNIDPFTPDDFQPCSTTGYFYRMLRCLAEDSLKPQIVLDPARDDIVISAFSASGSTVTWFPAAGGWSYYGNETSNFTQPQVEGRLDPAAPATGFVMVEIFYNYDMILKLPWITAFVPDPVRLHAYSIMPNSNVEPTPTP